jgi:hypothetical protein
MRRDSKPVTFVNEVHTFDTTAMINASSIESGELSGHIGETEDSGSLVPRTVQHAYMMWGCQR